MNALIRYTAGFLILACTIAAAIRNYFDIQTVSMYATLSAAIILATYIITHKLAAHQENKFVEHLIHVPGSIVGLLLALALPITAVTPLKSVVSGFSDLREEALIRLYAFAALIIVAFASIALYLSTQQPLLAVVSMSTSWFLLANTAPIESFDGAVVFSYNKYLYFSILTTAVLLVFICWVFVLTPN